MNSFAPITAHPALACAALLTLSNVFMTFAWYGHLKNLRGSPWWRRRSCWGIALFEYLLQVPANRIGYGVMSLAQLKILQEVITLSVFVPFAVLYMGQPMKLDFLWAGAVPARRGLLRVPELTDFPAWRVLMKASSAASACAMCAVRSLQAAATSPARHSRTIVACSFRRGCGRCR